MYFSDSALHKDLVVHTWSGKRLHLLAPDPAQIEIEDIAHGLAYQCCPNGQIRHYYSVAQHSMLVAQQVPSQHSLAALLHDGAAAYIGGISRPLRSLMPGFHLIEKRIMGAFSEKFGIADMEVAAIRRAHLIVQATEYRDLFCHAKQNEDQAELVAPIPRRIEALPPEEAKYQFIEILSKLVSEAGLQNSPSTSEHQKSSPNNRRVKPGISHGKSCQVLPLRQHPESSLIQP
jgi:5'-deoxynucleotidase YfbR-like HD superfamily hydrolase